MSIYCAECKRSILIQYHWICNTHELLDRHHDEDSESDEQTTNCSLHGGMRLAQQLGGGCT